MSWLSRWYTGREQHRVADKSKTCFLDVPGPGQLPHWGVVLLWQSPTPCGLAGNYAFSKADVARMPVLAPMAGLTTDPRQGVLILPTRGDLGER